MIPIQTIGNHTTGKSVAYIVDISTSYEYDSGTNNWVYFTIIGSMGNTTEIGLDVPIINDMMWVLPVFDFFTRLTSIPLLTFKYLSNSNGLSWDGQGNRLKL